MVNGGTLRSSKIPGCRDTIPIEETIALLLFQYGHPRGNKNLLQITQMGSVTLVWQKILF